MAKVTIRDVAAAAGVSHQTVSRVLNRRPDVANDTRERVLAAMERLGYRPHALARGLASKRSRIMALHFPVLERGIGATELELIAKIADAAVDKGYNPVSYTHLTLPTN